MEGYEKNEICNREGCTGIIDESAKEGCCSCHINPPCGYCEEPVEYCPECGWDAKEERIVKYKVSPEIEKKNQEHYAEQNRKWSEARDLFYKKYRGETPSEEIEIRSESHTHFSMKKLCVFPKGTTQNELLPMVRGTFGGRFTRFNDYSCEYIAYTD